VNSYAWYQARNIREEVMAATAAQMDAMAASTPAVNRAPLLKAAERYRSLAEDQKKKKQEQLDNANKLAKDYDALNVHDDQFDLSDAFLAIAISLLALTALTQKRWLYGMAMLPTVFGIYMGLAGLLGWGVRFSFFSKLLGT
jgi:hypothetical protein